jgi:hypothetical protein
MQQRLLTATEINSGERNKLIQIGEKLKLYNKKKIGEQIDIFGGVGNLTKEQKQDIISRVENSDESKKHKIKLLEKLGKETTNLQYFRRNISDLNDLDTFAYLVEECNIQNVEDFTLMEYNDVLKLSQQNTHLVEKITKEKSILINEHKPLYEENLDILELLVTMRKMYKIKNSIDDMELYGMFEAENNIDFAHKMSDLILNNKSKENILNSLLDGSQLKKLGISSLVKQKIISNKLFGVLLSRNYITNNQVTLLENSFTNNDSVINVFKTRTIGEILFEITNDENMFLVKELRHQIYMTFDGLRPSGNDYHKWNGLQVLDLDLSVWISLGNSLSNLKTLIHRELSKFHWYMWTCLSTSGNGLHIYTKVTPPHHVWLDVFKNENMCKYWYKINYVTKYNTVNSILKYLSDTHTKYNIKFDSEVFENKYLDVTVGRITSGIKITYDSNVLINENFVDLHVGLGLTQTINVSESNHYGDKYSNEFEVKNYLMREDSKLIKLINNEMLVDDRIHIEEIDLSKFVKLNSSFNEDKITELPRKSINYTIRWNVCNTLASLYGKDGLVFAHKILNSSVSQNESEINAFYQTAITSGKKPTRIGLEILKRSGLIKFIQEIDAEGVEVENPLLVETEDIYRKELRESIMKSIHNATIECDYVLGDNEYLSDIKSQLIEKITGDKITVILSPPGTGKTEMIKTLARDGKRILLVLPYVSVINNKIVTDESITEMFDSFYGDKDFKTLEHGRNAVTTFDKFSKSNYEKLSSMFDYIFIDESHLLFVSQYRVEATSYALKKIKDLFYISNNSPISAKIVLLTGTETGESYFFGKVANIIRVTKNQIEKNTEFHICGDLLDATTRLVSVARDYLAKGYKLLIPTNAGEIYVERMVGMLNFLRGDSSKEIKYGYYKSANKEQEICQLIDIKGTIGDYDIVFCTNYLSVGVDINDKHFKFASLFFGNFCAFEIEQFNARIRKTAIESHIFVATTKANGDFLPQMMEEPNLLLRVNDEDLKNFGDDKIISGAKQEFIAEYDPVLFKISTPGFNIFNGKIQFNLEEYELINFENKLLECMSHPIKISRELAKYGCNIKVSTENRGLSLLEQKILKKIGTQSALTEKLRKHDLMVQTYRDLITGNHNINENSIEFNNSIDWIMKNPKLVKEDRSAEFHVKIFYSMFGQPEYCIVKSREYLDKIIKTAKFISEKYTKIRALNYINDFISSDGVLNVSEFERNIKLLKIMDKSNAGELSEPITNLMDKIYSFLNQFDNNKTYGISQETYQAQIDNWCFDYMDSLNISVGTKYAFDKFKDSVLDILQTLSLKSKTKYGIRFRYNTVAEQDGSNSRINIENIVVDMFKLTREISSNNKTKKFIDKHIIQQYF